MWPINVVLISYLHDRPLDSLSCSRLLQRLRQLHGGAVRGAGARAVTGTLGLQLQGKPGIKETNPSRRTGKAGADSGVWEWAGQKQEFGHTMGSAQPLPSAEHLLCAALGFTPIVA